ncbi:hypothetical protein AX15_004307 [Amanita polypyramis BW_CC]|nr:hypothetical protein AX15_004307 [Amanita polypyramis BW_CC]
MPLRRVPASHARIFGVNNALEERDPGLLPLPSLLALTNSLLDPLLGSNSPSPSPNAPALPTPSPTSLPGDGGSSPNGSNGGNPAGGGNNGGSPLAGGGTNNGGSPSTSGGGDNGGSPTTSGGGNNGGSPTTRGGGNNGDPSTIDGNPSSGSDESTGTTGGENGNIPTTPSQGNPAGETDPSQTGKAATSLGSMNRAASSNHIAATPISSTLLPAGTVISPYSGSVNSGGGESSLMSAGGGANTDGGRANSGALNQSHGLHGGAIAGIVIAIIVTAVVVILLVLRKRAVSRRAERMQWWFNREGNVGLYGDNNSPRSSTISRRADRQAGARSARSSFATTFDQSQSPQLDFDFSITLPPIPPMAEIRGDGPIIGIDSSYVTPAVKRNSVGTNHSVESDPNAQYLLLPPTAQGKGELGTPMSVRPFSPSESYSFPKPPKSDTNSGDWGSPFSHKSSNGQDNIRSLTATSPTLARQVENPFVDPAPAGSVTEPAFADVETIRRPFVPTLPDELPVTVGDRVMVLHAFDDGWALVEKVSPVDDKNGKTKAVNAFNQGLIPIDCLRDAKQDLPAFLAQKRVSSYGESGDVYTE